MKTITLPSGVTLAYREYGSGDRYLLCTQNFFFENCHEAMLGRPPYAYHVFLVYMRGYGESDHIYDSHPTDLTRVWGEDLLAFADAMGIKSFFYTGVSHGNFGGWYLAFHHPQVLRGFVCCNGIPLLHPSPDWLKRTQTLPKENPAGNPELLEKMAWIEKWPTGDPARLKRRRENHLEHFRILMERKPEEFTVRNNNFLSCDAASEEEFYRRAAKLTTPILLVHGALDPNSTVEDALRLAKVIPHSRLLVLQELGHGGADECPELAARVCDRFFRDVEGGIQ